MRPTHLADASALALLSDSEVAARLVPLLVGGGAATCAITDLEVVAAFPDVAERADVSAERRTFARVPIDDRVLDRALEVQLLVPEPLRIGALVVAAAAEQAGLVLLHDDPVYDAIARATGQPVERV